MNYWYNIDLMRDKFYTLPTKKKHDALVMGYSAKNKKAAVKGFVKKIYVLKGSVHNSQHPMQWTLSDKAKLDKALDIAYDKYFKIYPELFV